MIKYLAEITEKYKEPIWELLVLANNEFIPPLSYRQDTTQADLKDGEEVGAGPVDYFDELLKQSFIICVEDGTVKGFMSFRQDHSLELDGENILCDYISTIIVHPKFRNSGITKRLYKKLFAKRKGNTFQKLRLLQTR